MHRWGCNDHLLEPLLSLLLKFETALIGLGEILSDFGTGSLKFIFGFGDSGGSNITSLLRIRQFVGGLGGILVGIVLTTTRTLDGLGLLFDARWGGVTLSGVAHTSK